METQLSTPFVGRMRLVEDREAKVNTRIEELVPDSEDAVCKTLKKNLYKS